jgi:peptidoglycan hydrolase CwlO-like protein
LAAIFASLVVITSMVGATPTDRAYGGDPLSDAQAKQRELQQTLSNQQSELAALRALSSSLDAKLAAAERELASVSAEYEKVAALLTQVQDEITQVVARLEVIRTRIASLDRMLEALAAEIERQTRKLETREALLEDHFRDAYERSQTSLLEVILAAESFETVATQVGYLLTVSQQDAAIAEEVRDLRLTLEQNRQSSRWPCRRASRPARRSWPPLSSGSASSSSLPSRGARPRPPP